MKFGNMKYFVTTFFLLGVVAACGSSFYPYYGLDQVNYAQGKLLGLEPSEDLPFMRCAPNNQVKNPCVVMFAKDFFALKQDYEDTQQKLKECQKP